MSDEATPKITYTVKKHVDGVQLRKDLAINPTDVQNTFLEHASMFAHYGVLLSKASKQVDDLKMLLETAEAKVDKRIRNEAADAGEKLTEPAIAKRVATHPRVLAFRKLLNEARQIESLGKSAVEAFKQRRDMLVQYGIFQREEMKGEVSIARRNAVEEEHRGLRERTLSRIRGGSEAEAA